MNKQKICCSASVLAIAFSMMTAVPQKVVAQTEKGIELYNSGEFRKAEGVLQEVLKTKPSDMAANFYLGLSVLLQARYKEALDIFLKVNDDQAKTNQRSRPPVPNKYQIQIALARARLGLKQFPEAWKNLESSKIENSGSSDVYLYRGLYYLLQEKNPEAISELEKAIKLDAKNAYAYYYAGVANDREGHAERAVQLLKIFLQLAPDAPEASEAKSIIDRLC
jgi:tetratricopeptide (TPR) repeat protein